MSTAGSSAPAPDATSSIAVSAISTLAEGQFDLKPTPPRRRALRAAGWTLAGLLALLALAAGGLWLWAGTDGSLATALRWAGAKQPLVTEEVQGNLRSSGKVGRLVWEQGGLRVEVQDAEIQWTPLALLSRTLRIDRLAARRILIDDQSTKGEPSAGPPASLALPLRIDVRALAVGELRWAGPPAYALQDAAGRFAYDGRQHLLELDRARVEGGDYRARAAITARAPIGVDVALAGALAAPVPGASAPVPLTLQARLHGPLTEMRAQADLRAVPAQPGASAPAPAVPALPAPGEAFAPPAEPASAAGGAEVPAAHATARLTPWAAQPLPEAHARLRALDVGALWAEAPHTHLNGQLDLQPLPAGGAPGWTVQADIANGAPGPWDQRRLPLDRLQADLRWTGGVADVRALRAQVGGGTLQASGHWAAPPSPHASAPAVASPGEDWRIDARVEGVNPARLHTQMAAFPLDGTATVSGQGATIGFDAALQARAQRAAAPARAGESAADALARDLRALRLRDLAATGRWADGVLALSRLRVRTDEAQLAGSAQVRPAGPGGSADLTLTAPGTSWVIQGEAQPDRGAGTLRARIDDAARTLAWARKLPGAAAALDGARARGRATLDARWRGGWRDPALQARLAVPSLDLRLPGADESTPPIQARGVDVSLDGKLAQARLEASGSVGQGERQLDLQLAATGGRTTPQAALADSGWRAQIGRLQAGVRDPLLGEGRWQIASRGTVPLSWSPAQGGQFEAGAGEIAVTSPAPAAQALVAWGPARWRGGELTTTGRITGLPLQWAERLGGPALAEAGLTGDVVFNGQWDAALGRALRVNASLARASGDVTLLASDAQTGVQSRVAAGLREARLALASDGRALNLQLKWDSAQAGTVDARLRTELTPVAGAGGQTRWTWPETAPLQGQVQAQLPQISAWSVLAPPGWRLRGTLAADARVSGTRSAPLVHGTLNADRLALRSVVDGLQLGGGRLRARLNGTRLLIDEFSLRGPGRQGEGGLLRATGEAGWIDGRAQARLSATLERLRASVHADRQMTVSGAVQAALDGRAVKTDGRLRVDRALIQLPDESTPTLGSDVVVRGAGGQAAAGRQAPGAVARPTSTAGRQADAQDRRAGAQAARGDPLTVDARVQIDLGEDFRLRGQGIDTRLAGELQLAAAGPVGTPPRLTGVVRTVGGTFHAYGQNLNVQRGNVTFSGAIDNPALDIVALRPNYASDQRAGVQVMGTALLPHVRLYSEPALPDNQTLAWLLLGRPAPDSGAEAAMLQSAALALLGGREGRGLAANFGLDELSFSGGTEGAVAGASVTLGKRLSDRLYAAYEHSIAGASGTLLIFYELSRRWTLRGRAGEQSAVDLIYRLSFD